MDMTTSTTTPQPRSYVNLLIGIAVTFLSIGMIWWFVDLQEVGEALRSANYIFLVAVGILIVLFLWFRSIRWRLLLNDIPQTATVFHIQNIGYMLTMLLPFRLGDVGRVILMGARPNITPLQAAATMVVERLLDLLFFIVLLPFVVAQLPNVPPEVTLAGQTFGTIAIIGVVVLVLIANQEAWLQRIINQISFLKRFKPQIDNLFTGLKALTSWKTGTRLILWSILIWIPVIIAYDMALRAVDTNVPPVMVAFTVCMAAFGVAAPSSPGQFGVFHLSVLFALTTVLGYPASAILSFAILYHTLQFILFILFGAFGLYMTGTSWRELISSTSRQPA